MTELNEDGVETILAEGTVADVRPGQSNYETIARFCAGHNIEPDAYLRVLRSTYSSLPAMIAVLEGEGLTTDDPGTILPVLSVVLSLGIRMGFRAAVLERES